MSKTLPCPKCQRPLTVHRGTRLMSLPPQYRVTCECGHHGSVMCSTADTADGDPTGIEALRARVAALEDTLLAITEADPDAAAKFARALPTIEEMRKADEKIAEVLRVRGDGPDGSPSRTLAELHDRMAYGPKVTK